MRERLGAPRSGERPAHLRGMSTTQPRVPAGTRIGGRFAAVERAEADVNLDAPGRVDQVCGSHPPMDDPIWAAGMHAPNPGLHLARPSRADLTDPVVEEDAITSVQVSRLSQGRADHATGRTVRGWLSWAADRGKAESPGSEAAQRYEAFAAGVQHGVLALMSSTAEVRDEYVVARIQRELGAAPMPGAWVRARREMTSKRTSKASRDEWASMVRAMPQGPMRRGALTAGLALSGQDGWWRLREDPEGAIGR